MLHRSLRRLLHAQTTRQYVPRYRKQLVFAVGGGLILVGLSQQLDDGDTRKNGGWSWCSSVTQNVFENWSGTHVCHPKQIFRPNSLQEVEAIVEKMHKSGTKLRCVGSGLSPNGIGFSEENLITLENMNGIVHVDKSKKQVTVECGALIGQLLDELKEYDLTLENLASINQQQVGGFTQVGAHGTGASIPPVEEQIVSLEIVTPGKGTLTLSKDHHPQWFHMVKCGLGCFGVVTKVTLQCVDAHRLVEDTVVMSKEEIKRTHVQRLQQNRHVRYMWIPHTDYAVVVTSNKSSSSTKASADSSSSSSIISHAEKVRPLISLLEKTQKSIDQEKLSQLGFGELRDHLLRAGPGPLSTDHVKAVNKAELEFWKRSKALGVVDHSCNVLGFDCGGQQLVLETVLRCGTQTAPDGKDLEFVDAIMKKIKELDFPAPAPIEQRWTCGSAANMSPVHDNGNPKDALFSWVGIILYLPTKDPRQREAIMNKFKEYGDMVQAIANEKKYDLRTHWAKIEKPQDASELQHLRLRLAKLYDVKTFQETKKVFDPNGILANDLIDSLLLLKN